MRNTTFLISFSRSILRQHNCLALLLDQLTSSSLTIVSNACGALWNFSAHSRQDQETLRALNAIPMLKSLTKSKHKTIATCSEHALKNITSGLQQVQQQQEEVHPVRRQPSLEARKKKNLMLELDEHLVPTCDDGDDKADQGGSSSDEEEDKSKEASTVSLGGRRPPSSTHRSESKDSLSSTHSVSSMPSDFAHAGRGGGRFEDVLEEENGEGAPSVAVRHPLELSKSRKQFFLKPMQQEQHNGFGGHAYHHHHHSPHQAPPPQAMGGGQQFPDQSQQLYRQQDGVESHPSERSQTFDLQSFPNYAEAHLQPQQQTAPPLLNNFVASPLSPDAEAFAERDERIMSPSNLEVMRTSYQQQNNVGDDEEDNDDNEERPTDYSARFGDNEDVGGEDEDDENDLAEEEGQMNVVAQGRGEDQDAGVGGDMEDTVKTYCVEDTPCDTPYHASNAGSISDLRDAGLDEAAGGQRLLFSRRPMKAVGPYSPPPNPPTSGGGGGGSAECRSGMETPMSERPRAFYTEDTPRSFSERTSLSSLDSADNEKRALDQRVELEHGDGDLSLRSVEDGEIDDEEKGQVEASHSKEASPQPRAVQGDREGGAEGESRSLTPPPPPLQHPPARPPGCVGAATRSVTFNPHETPLMFSRHSSAESLNSFDQHSVQDGYSSCATSRATSGRISPSDLPDSPGAQTPARRHHSPRRKEKSAADPSHSAVPPAGAPSASGEDSAFAPPPFSAAKDPAYKQLDGFPSLRKEEEEEEVAASTDPKRKGKASTAAEQNASSSSRVSSTSSKGAEDTTKFTSPVAYRSKSNLASEKSVAEEGDDQGHNGEAQVRCVGRKILR